MAAPIEYVTRVMIANWGAMPLPSPFSDGIANHNGITNPLYHADTQDILYQSKIATLYMREWGPQYGADMDLNYRFLGLPANYAVYKKYRAKSPKAVDRYIFGHPSGKRFDSPNAFFPHFLFLMRGGVGHCTCKLCEPVRKKPNPIQNQAVSSASSAPSARKTRKAPPPHMAPTANMTAPFQMAYPTQQNVASGPPRTLEYDGTASNTTFVQSWSDYAVASRVPLELDPTLASPPHSLGTLPAVQHRLGEVVLFARERHDVYGDMNKNVSWTVSTSESTNVAESHSIWEAGIVCEVHAGPDHTQSSYCIQEIQSVDASDKDNPPPLHTIKFRDIRPFSMILEAQNYTAVETWKPTTQHALKVFGSVSFASYPTRVVETKDHKKWMLSDIWAGSELIREGDVVKLLTRKHNRHIHRVMVVMSITVTYAKEGSAVSHPVIQLTGPAYNSEPCVQSTRNTPLNEHELALCPVVMRDRMWYPFKGSEYFTADLYCFVGRLHESWGIDPFSISTPLGYGEILGRLRSSAVQAAMTRNPQAIPGLIIYETRAQSLGIHWFNEENVGMGLYLAAGLGLPTIHAGYGSKVQPSVADSYGIAVMTEESEFGGDEVEEMSGVEGFSDS